MDGESVEQANRRQWWRKAVWLVIALIGPCHAADTLQGAWRDVRPGDTPQTVLAAYRHGDFHRFDPGQLQRFPQEGSWVVLQPEPPWVDVERALSIYPPPMGQVTLYDARGMTQTNALNDFSAITHGHGRVTFRVDADVTASQPLLLKFESTSTLSAPVSFALQSRADYEQDDASWLAFASACFAVMLAMTLMALCFSTMLRDPTFGWYAGYMLCYMVIQAVQTGYLFHPLGLAFLAHSAMTLAMCAVVLSVAFAALFMARFCELRSYAPWLHPPVVALAAGMPLILVLRGSHIEVLEQTAQILINPVLILGALLLLLAAIVAVARGSRHAWFFLLGWTPLLVLTALCSSQIGGALPHVLWLNDASVAAGAFEAIVLSLGLADRALNVRRDRDIVRVLADNDALTNILNRRAWTEGVREIFASSPGQPLALLFLDLDNFKSLNDKQGHAAGDRALVAVASALRHELRPADLLGRYGGEEFVAMLHGIDQERAMQVATRLCRRVHRLEIPVDGKGVILSVSIGVAMRSPGDTVESIVERADQAMYGAKVNGRNRVQMDPRVRPTVVATKSISRHTPP